MNKFLINETEEKINPTKTILFAENRFNGVVAGILTNFYFEEVEIKLYEKTDASKKIFEFFSSLEFKKYKNIIFLDLPIDEDMAVIFSGAIGRTGSKTNIHYLATDKENIKDIKGKYPWAHVEDGNKTENGSAMKLYKYLCSTLKKDHRYELNELLLKAKDKSNDKYMFAKDEEVKKMYYLISAIGIDAFCEGVVNHLKAHEPIFSSRDNKIIAKEKRKYKETLGEKKDDILMFKINLDGTIHKFGVTTAVEFIPKIAKKVLAHDLCKDLEFLVILDSLKNIYVETKENCSLSKERIYAIFGTTRNDNGSVNLKVEKRIAAIEAILCLSENSNVSQYIAKSIMDSWPINTKTCLFPTKNRHVRVS